MPFSHALLVSLAVSIIAAALEGVCAGRNVRRYFATLDLPPYSPPLWLWFIIGGFYYLIFTFVMFRVLRHDIDSAFRIAALTLIGFMMAVNALWNYIFFRAQKLFLGFVVAGLFPILDISLLICVIQFDRVAAWSLVPYLLYRMYGLWWGYGLWKLNG